MFVFCLLIGMYIHFHTYMLIHTNTSTNTHSSVLYSFNSPWNHCSLSYNNNQSCTTATQAAYWENIIQKNTKLSRNIYNIYNREQTTNCTLPQSGCYGEKSCQVTSQGHWVKAPTVQSDRSELSWNHVLIQASFFPSSIYTHLHFLNGLASTVCMCNKRWCFFFFLISKKCVNSLSCLADDRTPKENVISILQSILKSFIPLVRKKSIRETKHSCMTACIACFSKDL